MSTSAQALRRPCNGKDARECPCAIDEQRVASCEGAQEVRMP